MPWPVMTKDERAHWDKCFPNKFGFISPLGFSVADESALAHTRYSFLLHLEHLAPQWPLLAILLAELHFLLKDTYGSLRLAQWAQYQVEVGTDTVLDQASANLVGIVRKTETEQPTLPVSSSASKLTQYSRLHIELTVQHTTDWKQLHQEWQSLTASESQNRMAIEWLARYISITTNEIEGVFTLDRSSLHKLVKRGFYINSITGFSLNSRLKKHAKVVDILQNTNSCFKQLRYNPSEYTETLIKNIHSTLLLNDNIHEETDGYSKYYHLVPRGEYRHVFCYAVHDEREREIHYCTADKVPTEMSWYIEQAQLLLSRPELDPFYVSAWLQWAFLFIHPFADGNGRVARMISSIPLMIKKLPPVVVVQDRKAEYFAALFAADQDADLSRLALFLKSEADRAIKYLQQLEPEGQLSPASTAASPTTPESSQSGSSEGSSASISSLGEAIANAELYCSES
ncbi:hypothetical protein HDV05_007085 [Chytridiales sp. JEL 0842]|nr:hypothetical protein HDV05_007085 [Chytridiales sp. JEL 0842]